MAGATGHPTLWQEHLYPYRPLQVTGLPGQYWPGPWSLGVPWRESLAPTNGGCTDDLSQGIMAEVGGFHGEYEQAGIREYQEYGIFHAFKLVVTNPEHDTWGTGVKREEKLMPTPKPTPGLAGSRGKLVTKAWKSSRYQR